MTDAILCVDDEFSVLAAFQRQFRKRFNLVSAMHGGHGLIALNDKGPFAVVLSDYNMPGMTGLMFLRKVREKAPETSRLLLTGKADAELGMAAINDGTLFRFLNKPCSPETLAGAFTDALEQHRLVTSERLLRAQILETGLGLMAEVQGHLRPEVMERASRIQATVEELVTVLRIAEPETFLMAAKLSHVGCVGIPEPLVARVFTAGELTAEEQTAFCKHAELGGRMIRHVPGLEVAAAMVQRQFEVESGVVHDHNPSKSDPVVLGSQLLRLASDFETYICKNPAGANTFDGKAKGHDPVLVDALKSISGGKPGSGT